MTETKRKWKQKDRSSINTFVERHVVKPKNSLFSECQRVCALSKNLYNATLYEVRQSFFQKSYLNYFAVNAKFTKENQVDYRALPAKVAKQTQLLVDKNFKSFFTLKKKVGKDPFVTNPRIPKYLKSDGCFITHYEKGALSFKEKGFIKLSKTEIRIKTGLTRDQVTSVRVVPKGNHFVLEVIYEEPKVAIPTDRVDRVAFIDPGLDNLMTVTSNVFSPLIINGKPVKALNQLYNKKKAKLQSHLFLNTSKANRLLGKVLYSTPALQALSFKRQERINHYFHKATTYLVNHFISHQIETVVFGHNKGQKLDIKLGKKTNQSFVQLPFALLLSQLAYKCARAGIHFVETEESYTSKASFLDKDHIPVYEKDKPYLDGFSGKRIKRGLYRSKNDIELNADVNGSLNIGRKYLT